MDSNLEITMGDDHSIKSKSKGTMSLRELSIEAYQTTFAGNLCNISKGGKLILRARETDSLYQIDLLSRALVTTRSMAQCPPTNTDSPAPQVLSPPAIPLKDVSITPGEPPRILRSDSIELWHRRPAHLNSSVMKKLLAAMV
jgi:hypothetical protein